MARVLVQEAAFDLAAETAALGACRTDVGGIASFLGVCRADDGLDTLNRPGFRGGSESPRGCRPCQH